MQNWIDTVVEPTRHPQGDDLLRVYLGQSTGTSEPEPDAPDLWDRLGDFA